MKIKDAPAISVGELILVREGISKQIIALRNVTDQLSGQYCSLCYQISKATKKAKDSK